MKRFQVTIGSSATQISALPQFFKFAILQNNGATNAMRIGDSSVTTSRGLQLVKGGGSVVIGPLPDTLEDASKYFVAGTQNDVVDVEVFS